MDEAARLIAELQQKLAQLDHKIWLYRKDMASEFKKYADDLLRDVSGDVSDTVNKAIAESLKSYPSLDAGSEVADALGGAVNKDASGDRADDSLNADSELIPIPVVPDQGPESPLEGPPNAHEREQEFQGLFTPSYLPLLDSTDRNERRSSSISLSPASECKAIGIIARERATESTSPTSSSAPSSSSLPLRKPPTPPRRRNTDENLTNSDHSDSPIRRSALRRTSNSIKQPQSPRHVRFEFAGEEFPTTSSPKLDSYGYEHVHKVPIILGNGEGSDYGTALLEGDGNPESPPQKRVSSSEALRALSRGPIEDDGTQWTEVTAPSDGSASVPKAERESDDSEDEDSLSMRPMTVREAAARSNGNGRRSPSPKTSSTSYSHQDLVVGSSQSQKDMERERDSDNTKPDIAEHESALADLPPLQPMKTHTPMTTVSATELQHKYADKSKTVATKSPGKPWFVLADGTNLNDLPESKAKLEVKDDDDEDAEELFEFDEVAERPQKALDPEPDSEPDSAASDTAEDAPESISKYATSPARNILKPSSTPDLNTSASTNTNHNSTTTPTPAPNPAPSTSHRSSSYHPFNTPIVSDAIHAQAASLGHVQSFVGSVKDGLDEDALQSFRFGAGGAGGVVGVGSLRGGAPRSLSEKMAFDDAMEAQQRERDAASAAGAAGAGRKR